MARMKRKRKYRSSVFSNSSWSKRVSCRRNMHKARIKANAKARHRRQTTNINPTNCLLGLILNLIILICKSYLLVLIFIFIIWAFFLS